MRNSPQESDDQSFLFSPPSVSAENSSKPILPEESKLPGKKSHPAMERLYEKYPSTTPSENSSDLLFQKNMLLPGENSVSAMERLREKQALIEAEERADDMRSKNARVVQYNHNDADIEALIESNNREGEKGHFSHFSKLKRNF